MTIKHSSIKIAGQNKNSKSNIHKNVKTKKRAAENRYTNQE